MRESAVIRVDDLTPDELRLAARMARDMAARADAAGLDRVARVWRHCLARIAAEHNQRTESQP